LFVEPTSVPLDSNQKQQLVLLDSETGSLLWKLSSFGNITADWGPIPAAKETSQSATAPLAGRTGMLFVSPDYALAFYEPVSGQVQKLTPSFSGNAFSVSPDGTTVLFGDQTVSIQSQPNGSVSASIVETSNPDDFLFLNWSPDGQKYGYVEHDGAAWMVDLLGNRQQLFDSDSPPDWSYDGRWMAYCDKEGRLWIAESGKPADWIIPMENCAVNWSPTQSILAYYTYSAIGTDSPENFANGTAFLYDPVSGGTKEIAQSMSGVDWSPDGKLLSIGRITSVGASNYSDPYFSPDSSWLVMDQTNVVGENLSKISLMELKSGQTKEIQAGLNMHSTWFQMPSAPIVPTSPSKEPAATLSAESAVPTDAHEKGPIDLQNDSPKGNSQLAMLAILLWAGALIAIVILMLYLWRQSSAAPKQAKEKAPDMPVEEKPAPLPSHEEIENTFQQGVELVRAGKAEEGIAQLTKVITAEPENNVAWFWLGIASARQKEYRVAERCFLQAKRHGHPEAEKALVWLKTQHP
jgi:TolA-binding protein